MEYSRIVAVTGMPGLYEIVSSKTDGAIVRSLEDGSTKFVSSRVHNLSHLESIEIYTTGENVTLGDVFGAMKESAEAKPDVKDGKALRGYFEKVYPDMDFDRVYASDMKKMVTWAAVLDKHNVDYTPKAEDEETEGDEASTEASATAEPAATEPDAKPAIKTKKAAAETLEAAGEKVVLESSADAVPEAGDVKTKKARKKKTDDEAAGEA